MEAAEVFKKLAAIERQRVLVSKAQISEDMKKRLLADLDGQVKALSVVDSKNDKK